MHDNDLKALRWSTGVGLLALLAILFTAMHCDAQAQFQRDACKQKLSACQELCK